MKMSGKLLVLTVASAALAASVLGAPAVAAGSELGTPTAAAGSQLGVSSTVEFHTRGDGTQPPAELGNPEEWGVATFTIDDSTGPFTTQTVVPASGGTWSYGWELRNNLKYCYSNYFHNTKYHSSSVTLAGTHLTGTAAPGGTSNAHLSAGLAYTCSTYYSVN